MLSKVSYEKGMNQALSFQKRDGSMYFEAKNLTIVQNGSNKSFNLTLEKGTKKLIDLELEYQTLTGSSDNIYIVGGVGVDKDLFILTTTESNNTNPTFGTKKDQMWLLKFEDEIFGGYELLYDNPLSLSANNKVTKMISKIYSDVNKKVYWTDGINQLRHVNITEDLTTKNSFYFDSCTKVNLEKPTVLGVYDGGSLIAGKVFYCYTYLNKYGQETRISPISNGVNIGASGLGLDVGKLSNRTVKIRINNLDSTWDYIKVYKIHYTDKDVPVCNLIKAYDIDSTSITIVDDGSEYEQSLTKEDLLFIGSQYFIPYTFEEKDNRLFPFNITQPSFDVSYDARAFGFPASSSSTTIKDKNGVSYGVNSSYAVNEKHDCINPNFDVYKFKRLSTTLGGSGKNVSYEIDFTKQWFLDDFNETLPSIGDDESKVNKITDSTRKASSAYDPVNSNVYTTYRSREVYRFGIVFGNNLGQTSFVKWIADIKMPRLNDSDNSDTNELFSFNNTTKAISTYITGIKFSVNITQDLLDAGVTYFKIVRVKREQKDKTILSSGIGQFAMNYEDGASLSNQTEGSKTLFRPSILPLQNVYTGAPSLFMSINRQSWSTPSDLFTNGMALNNIRQVGYSMGSPGYFCTSTNGAYTRSSLYNYYSPEISFNKYLYDNSDLKVTVDGYYGENVGYVEVIGENSNSLETASKCKICSGTSNPSKTGLTKDILDVKLTRSNSAGDILTVYSDRYTHYAYTKDINLGAPSNYTRNIKSRVASGLVFKPSSLINESNFNSEVISKIPLMTIYRTLENQYGGNTYEDRSKNTYIDTNSHTAVTSTGIKEVLVYGGDTHISMFSLLYSSQDDADVTEVNSENVYALSVLSFPIESDFNIAYRTDKHYGRGATSYTLQETKSTGVGIYGDGYVYEDLYTYNHAYLQEYDFIPYFAKPNSLDIITQFKARVYASNLKIDNELKDNFLVFPTNQYKDLDLRYGEVKSVVKFGNIIFFGQEKAFGLLEVSPRVQTVASDGVSMYLGFGDLLHNYRYYSTEYGVQYPYAMTSSDRGVYYFDSIKLKFCLFSEGAKKISDILGVKPLIDTFKGTEELPEVIEDVNLVYDFNDDNVHINVKKYFLNSKPAEYNNVTVTYNELIGSFVGLFDYDTCRFFTNFADVFSSKDSHTIHAHKKGDRVGEFYGEVKPFYLIHILNTNPDYVKIFNELQYVFQSNESDNQDSHSNFDYVTVFNDHQSTGKVALVERQNTRKRFKYTYVTIPRDETDSKSRIRGQFVFVKLESENSKNESVLLSDMLYDSSISH